MDSIVSYIFKLLQQKSEFISYLSLQEKTKLFYYFSVNISEQKTSQRNARKFAIFRGIK